MCADKSCSHLLNQVMAWLASQEGVEFSSDTSAYTQARQRLPERALAQLTRQSGRQLELHLYHDRIVGYLERHPVVQLPRKRVSGKGKRRDRCINYRHVIGSLRLKPRAFIYCTWQLDLLPNPEYRQVWQELKAQFDLEQAAKIIVEGLYIAATQDKEQVVDLPPKK